MSVQVLSRWKCSSPRRAHDWLHADSRLNELENRLYVRAPKIATDFPTLVGGAWAFGVVVVVVVGGVRASTDPLYPPPPCAPATVQVYVWVCWCVCAAWHACVLAGVRFYVCVCVLCTGAKAPPTIWGGPLTMLLVEGIGGGYLVGVRACERPCGWWRGRRTQPRASHDVTAADPYPRGGCRRPHHGVQCTRSFGGGGGEIQ